MALSLLSCAQALSLQNGQVTYNVLVAGTKPDPPTTTPAAKHRLSTTSKIVLTITVLMTALLALPFTACSQPRNTFHRKPFEVPPRPAALAAAAAAAAAALGFELPFSLCQRPQRLQGLQRGERS